MARKCRDCDNLAYGHKRLCDDCLGLCSTCKKLPRRDPSTSSCLQCAAAYERTRRVRKPPTEADRQRDGARGYINRHKQTGIVQRGPCEFGCSTARTELMLFNYKRPPDYIWLCYRHHREVAEAWKSVGGEPKLEDNNLPRGRYRTRIHSRSKKKSEPIGAEASKPNLAPASLQPIKEKHDAGH